MISETFKTAVGSCGPNLGFEVKDMSSYSLRATGVMALLCSSVDSNIINMVGRWRSKKMVRYLYVQAEPLMRNLYRLILTHGKYSFLTHQEEVF